MTMRFYDTVPVSRVRFTDDGYLVGEAPVARTGIQVYAGHELGRPDMPIVRVYRPPEEVFSKDAMKSYAHRPVTVGHPPERVTADNWKEHSAGQTGDEVMRDGDVVRVPLVLMDADAIRRHQAGFRELSMGYDAEIEFTDGQTPDGEPYDAIQRNQRMNHLALVPRARGGERLRLGDDTEDGGKTMSGDSKTRTVTVDGLAVETTDAGAQAIERLQKDVRDAQTLLQETKDAHAAELKTRDEALAAKDAEIEKLKGQVMSADELDAKVRERADLVSRARAVADLDYTGKPDVEVRKMAVQHVLGDEAVADKSPEYVAARFDILAEDAAKNADPVRRASAAPPAANRQQHADADNGHSEYIQRLQTAWMDNAPTTRKEVN